MYEIHRNEQYFFNSYTLRILSNLIKDINLYPVCCLCAPLLGKKLLDIGMFPAYVDILDIDKRFSNLASFIHYDIRRPIHINYMYKLIVCDPPFFSVSLSQLFNTIYKLSGYDFNRKIFISYLKRRENAILGAFSKFNLEPTGFYPKYQTVDTSDRNKIELYGNIENFDKQPWANLLLK